MSLYPSPFTLHPSRRSSERGQFIPMAAMVMLSVVVFMVGIVNVYMVSRAKLRAQNLADAAAMYVAGHMVQSLNMAADENETLNHLYGDPNDPSYSQADHDPCIPPGDPTKVPPGIGCFANATQRPTRFVFGDVQAAIAYANLVHTVNVSQANMGDMSNELLGAQISAPMNMSSNSFQLNIYHAIPDLQSPDVFAMVYNSSQGQQMADGKANALDQAAKNNPHAAPLSGVESKALESMTYTPQDVTVKYTDVSLAIARRVVSKTLRELLGNTGPVGYMDVDYHSLHAWGGANPQIAAGAIVRITVHPIGGLGPKVAQARSTAYVVMKAGSVTYDSLGRFKPTYFVKLGKPL